MDGLPYDPYFHVRRKTYQILNIGSDQVPRVIGDLSSYSSIKPEDLGPFGYLYAHKRINGTSPTKPSTSYILDQIRLILKYQAL